MEKRPRLLVLDFLRGIAVLGMLFYHLIFDLDFFYGVFPGLSQGGVFWWIGRSSAVLFLLLVGVLSALSFVRYHEHVPFLRTLLRGGRIFLLGMVLTLVTFLFLPSWTIWFGILHCIGVSILFLPLFLSSYARLIGVCLFSFLVPLLFPLVTGGGWGVPFGFPPSWYQSLDYYPLFPWFGVVVLGALLGKVENGVLFYYADLWVQKKKSLFGFLFFCGRYSLWIYLLHQPLFLAVLWVFFA